MHARIYFEHIAGRSLLEVDISIGKVFPIRHLEEEEEEKRKKKKKKKKKNSSVGTEAMVECPISYF